MSNVMTPPILSPDRETSTRPPLGTVIYSKARRRLNRRTGRVVLKLQLSKAGRKLFKQTSGLIEVNVWFTLQTGGQKSLLTRFLTLFGTIPSGRRLPALGQTLANRRRVARGRRGHGRYEHR